MAEQFFDLRSRQKEVYSDIDHAFLSHPVSGKLTRKINREAVKQSVKSLILTDFYERPFQPDIGCSIRSLLFENWHPAVEELMRDSIVEVLNNYEPRASLLDVNINARPDSNSVSITIVFSIINDTEPVTLGLALERVR